MGAQLVPDFAENLTPDSELQKLRAPRETIILSRDRGSGRPTKKDRRQLDEHMDGVDCRMHKKNADCLCIFFIFGA